MQTATLKSFATKARTDLMKEVSARLDVVLAPGSNARAEQPGSVATLERAVEQTSREAVVDRVAYTWFNRIIALRYMDAKGYTGVGVVSPGPGKSTGQPQVLSDAKGGDFDSEVVSLKTQAAVTALLAPGAHGADPQGAAYGLLLEAYSRFWNKAMPFMFEREGDYTELLMPTGLLSADSLRGRAVTVLTEEVCDDVEVIGWLYQFYISERKDEVFDGFKKRRKAGAAEIPAATQLFTPHWIVRYLIENSLGRLWLLNYPHSRLAEQMDYYIAPLDEETNFLRVSKPEELKVLDPAAGSGHMLTYAFDLLYAIYEEEGYAPSEIPSLILQHNLYGVEIDPRAGALAAFALTMKAASRRKSFLKNPVQPNIRVLENVSFDPSELDYLWSLTRGASVVRADADEFWKSFEHADIFGSLIQPNEQLIALLQAVTEAATADGDLMHGAALEKASTLLGQALYLAGGYTVVVANPPYMGNANMDAALSEFARANYPNSKTDLFAMFIERAVSLVRSCGQVGMITMQSWMFLKSFRGLREKLLLQDTITTMAHLGSGAFDSIGGEVVGTTAFVLSKQALPRHRGVFFRLVDRRGEATKALALRNAVRSSEGVFAVSSDQFGVVPGSPLAYWLSQALRDSFRMGQRLDQLADVKQGLSTGKNAEVIRQWWEVAFSAIGVGFSSVPEAQNSESKWFPYNKGGQFRRWYGNVEHVLRYDRTGVAAMATFPGHRHDGKSHYFRPGVTWSSVSAGLPAFRYQPQGQIFDSAGNTFFPKTQADLFGMLAFANSPIATAILGAIAPTINFTAGNIAGLPVIRSSYASIDDRVRALIAIARADWDSQETSIDFSSPQILAADARPGLRDAVLAVVKLGISAARDTAAIEAAVNAEVIESYQLRGEVTPQVNTADVSLTRNPEFRFGGTPDQQQASAVAEVVLDLVSHAVGCMFGRYSLDKPGLILADQGSTLQDYLAELPTPSFMPDKDNVIPIVDGAWFEDDIVAKFRQFLRAAFGEQHFAENLKFVTDCLGVKDLREYFIRPGTKSVMSKFYDDHVSRYKKRPIYWLFSSPKGSFNALVYLHRYSPSTVSTVLNDYLREYMKKLEAELTRQEHIVASGAGAREVAAAQKEADRVRKVLIELDDYERELYSLASQQISLDLDDGVLVNYQKFGSALKDIGLNKGGSLD